jgi:Holliday junction resolvase
MKNEKDVRRKVQALLDKFGWFWWSIPATGYGQNGTSDMHALKNGVFMAIETKYGPRKPTPLQVGFLNSIRAEHSYAFVVSDRNLDWFGAFLESFDISTEAVSRNEMPPPEHGARLLNALTELSNKLLDTGAPELSVIEAT